MYEDKLTLPYSVHVEGTSTCTKSCATALLTQHWTKQKYPDNLQNLYQAWHYINVIAGRLHIEQAYDITQCTVQM